MIERRTRGALWVAVLAVLGQDTLILRSWGEFYQRAPAMARGAISYGFRVTTVGAVLAVGGLVGWAAGVDGRLGAADIGWQRP